MYLHLYLNTRAIEHVDGLLKAGVEKTGVCERELPTMPTP